MEGWTDHSVAALANGNESDYYQTPQLERLASEGVSFTSSYALPNCAPTRAALMSGQYAPRTGNGVYNVGNLARQGRNRTIFTNPGSQTDDFIDGGVDAVTIGEALVNSGYVTAHFGKYHVGSNTPSDDTHPLNQGYDHNFGGGAAGRPGSYFANNQRFANQIGPELDPFAADYTSAYIQQNLIPLSNGNDPMTLVGQSKFLTDAMGDAFISFINDHRGGPMAAFPVFIQLNFYAVHSPIQSRPDLLEKYQALPQPPNGSRHRNATYAGLLEGMKRSGEF